MAHTSPVSSRPETFPRAALVARFRALRERSRRLFDLLAEDAYYARPIPLRNPIVFYEGHLSAFAVNTLVKRALGGPGIDETLERLFARGIDPEDEAAMGSARQAWPARTDVRAYVREADTILGNLLEREDLDRPGHALLDGAEAVHAILEHEEMHQETLQYIFHRLPLDQKTRPPGLVVETRGDVPARDEVRIPAGHATIGAHRGEIAFGWDNEFPGFVAEVPPFAIDRHNVTNADFLEFVEAGGYTTRELWTDEAWAWIRKEGLGHPLFWERHDDRWFWRAMFDLVPLPESWPVYVTFAEASAYAAWRGKRLPTEAEFHRAAYGTPEGPERAQPWGDEEPGPRFGNFGTRHWDPIPAGSCPDGASAWGVHDLVGNGWDWTSTVFAGFPGFEPLASYPEYSADFFDGRHYVIKGASPATPAPLVRRTFRNWFRPHYPYVYASFRCVRS